MKTGYKKSLLVLAGGLIALVVFGMVWFVAGGQEVSLRSELTNLFDVRLFAVSPAGISRLHSSSDPTGGNRDWVYNEQVDIDGLITIAYLEGPGCVTRIWLTGQRIDDWLFFVDGEAEPRIRGIRRDQPTSPDDVLHAFTSPLQDIVSGGQYIYTPIPFRKSLRIAVSPDAEQRGMPYHQINYSTYSMRTRVHSFPRSLSSEQQAAVKKAQAAWENHVQDLTQAAHNVEKQGEIEIPPGGTYVWLDHGKAGLLDLFWFELAPVGDISRQQASRLLRQIVLKLYWEGSTQPSVHVPFGDFFGNAFYRRRYSSLALGNVNNRFVCRFPMPFHSHARGTITNESDIPIMVRWGVSLDQPSTGQGMRLFHAEWRQTDSPRRPPGRPHQVMRASGPGHLVGCYLNAISADQSWFILEGDENIIVTDSDPRVLEGTGLEDYFNGAWYYNGLNDLPFSGLLEKAAMCTDQYRLHLGDRIGFGNAVDFSFEFGHGNASKGYISSTSFWYAKKPSAVADLPPPVRRFPAQRPMEPHVLILELIELERAGLYEEALKRSRYYAERYDEHELGPLMALRALAYRDMLGEHDAAKEGYQAVLEGGGPDYLKHQATSLLALHESPNHAIIAAQGHGSFDVYLDGEKLFSGSDYRILYTAVVALGEGKHELAVKIDGDMPHDPWINVYVRTLDRALPFDAHWEHIEGVEPSSWPSTDQQLPWTANPERLRSRPRNSTWYFMPNAFAGFQNDAILWASRVRWKDREKGAAAYMRRKFSTNEFQQILN